MNPSYPWIFSNISIYLIQIGNWMKQINKYINKREINTHTHTRAQIKM